MERRRVVKITEPVHNEQLGWFYTLLGASCLLFQSTICARKSASLCQMLQINTSTTHGGYCDCIETLAEIQCQHLTAVPNLRSSSPFHTVNMARQAITEVPANAFVDLRVQRIVLNFNHLVFGLHEKAFTGHGNSLRELYLGGCRLDSLSEGGGFLSGLRQLRILHLWKNNLIRLPDAVFGSCCEQLRELSLWGNLIESFDSKTFSGLTSLRRLDLDNNKISSIACNAFKDLPSLQVLHLSGNSITSLASETFSHLSGSLRALSLNSNGLQYIYGRAFGGLQRLISLSLGNNEMTFLPGDAFIGMHNLSVLILKRGKLRSTFSRVFAGLQRLERLDLSSNDLSHLPDGCLYDSRQLKHVDLSNNKLVTLSNSVLQQPHRLKTLSVIGNVAFQCNCRLQWLIKTFGQMTEVWGTCAEQSSTVTNAHQLTTVSSHLRNEIKHKSCNSNGQQSTTLLL